MSARTNAAMPQVDWTLPDAQLTTAIDGYFATQSVPNIETPYWLSKRAELVERGRELNNPNYPNERLQDAEVFLQYPPHPAPVAPPAPLPTPVPQPTSTPAPAAPSVLSPSTSGEDFLLHVAESLDRIEAGITQIAAAAAQLAKSVDAYQVNGVKVRL